MITIWLAASELGGGDCETIRSGFLAQPGNAVSSLVYVMAGAMLVLLRRRLPETGRITAVGGLLVAVGAGSFLYHGPAPVGAQLAHDATIAALLGFLAWWSAPAVFSRWWWVVAGGVAAAGLAVFPTISGPVLASIGALSAVAVAVRLGRVPALRSRIAALVLVATVAAAAFVLGATGGPWCSPDSLVQVHAAWHALSALAVSLAAVSLGVAGSPGRAEHLPERVTR